MKNTFTVIINGDETREFSTLATFDIPSKNKSIVVYTDDSVDENNRPNIFVSSYDKYNQLTDITDPEEIAIIEKFIKDMLEDAQDGVEII